MPDNCLIVEVLLDQNLAKPLDYTVPSAWKNEIQIGGRVEVPLRNSIKKGTISAIKEKSRWPDPRPLTRLITPHSELSAAQWKLAEWMAQYYIAPLQRVLKCFIPPNIRKEVNPRKRVWITLLKTRDETARACQEMRGSTPLLASVLDELLVKEKGLFLHQLKIEKRALKKLIDEKWIRAETIALSDDLLLEEEFFKSEAKSLNEEQKICFEAIVEALEKNQFSAHLIQGVTGSGKTEIYLQAIQKTLDLGKSAILLVPEISLTSQTIERFRARFSEKIAILHHQRSFGERTAAWEELRSGQCRLVIGARSALFAPAQNLGLIIVDEEHDSSYKQSDDSPCYQARDVAVMRAHIEKGVVLLGSATPSIESRYNTEIGKYKHHLLTTRATTAKLPHVQIIDMKSALERTGGFSHFSPELLEAIEKRIKVGEQTLLFLNKRGYHRYQICASCREMAKCPHCDLSLTFHRSEERLRCHLCDYTLPVHRQCPSCKSTDTLEFKGYGTEHVERSLHAIFPEVRTLRMDRDTTRQKNSHEELFKQFKSHKADVLIGTQMIAKGLHFPAVTLVGILSPDTGLNVPDFRSAELTFQILTQVAGRSGRSELPGEVILQTFIPDHPVIQLASQQNFEAFYKETIEERRQFVYPPFCRLVKVVFTSPDAELCEMTAKTILQTLTCEEAEFLPVTPSGHPKIKDLYRFQFLIKCSRIAPLYPILSQIKQTKNVDIKIDVDPVNTFF